MIISNIVFFSLACLLYVVLFSISQQRRLLAMIFIFLNFAILFFYLHFEYLAAVLVIIYIGAISVLFLFVIMLVTLQDMVLTIRNYYVVFTFCFFIFISLTLTLLCLKENLVLIAERSILFENENFLLKTLSFWHNRPKILNALVYSDFLFLVHQDNDTENLYFLTQGQKSRDFQLNTFFMFNSEMEQLGLVFWSQLSLLILLSAIILITVVVGSVAVLKGIFSFNILQRRLVHNF